MHLPPQAQEFDILKTSKASEIHFLASSITLQPNMGNRFIYLENDFLFLGIPPLRIFAALTDTFGCLNPFDNWSPLLQPVMSVITGGGEMSCEIRETDWF